MASDTNIVLISGRLGDVMDIRMDAHPSVRFSLASNSYSRRPDAEIAEGESAYIQKTDWARVVAWGDLADSLSRQDIGVGDLVIVEGRWHSSKWTAETGETRNGVEVTASRVALLRKAGQPLQPDAAALDGEETDVWDDTPPVAPTPLPQRQLARPAPVAPVPAARAASRSTAPALTPMRQRPTTYRRAG